jgi:hypothetical protein
MVKVSAGGLTVSVAVFVTELSVALMVAVTVAETGVVDVVNVAVVAVAGTVTLTGTVTPLAVLLLDRVTTTPPVGAAPDRVTVPVEPVPPITVVGLSERPVSVGAVDAGVKSPRNG